MQKPLTRDLQNFLQSLLYCFTNKLFWRSLKDLDSDRGAETYDYTLIAAEKKREREREKKARKEEGKGNLGGYLIFIRKMYKSP